jgi:arginine:ornithine antiporter/lysine permease
VGASVLLWFVHWLVLRGVQTAASINLVATLAKLVPLGLFIVLAFIAFRMDVFSSISAALRWAFPSGSR